jgi:hypothetical protein
MVETTGQIFDTKILRFGTILSKILLLFNRSHKTHIIWEKEAKTPFPEHELRSDKLY